MLFYYVGENFVPFIKLPMSFYHFFGFVRENLVK